MSTRNQNPYSLPVKMDTTLTISTNRAERATRNQVRERALSLDEPESTDRNTPLGKQPWYTDTGFSTHVPTVDLNIVDATSVIDVVDDKAVDADYAAVFPVDGDVTDADPVLDEAVDGSVLDEAVDVDSVVDTPAAGDGVDRAVSVAEVVHVVAIKPTIVDAAGSEDVCHSVAVSSFAVREGDTGRSCLINPSVVQRK